MTKKTYNGGLQLGGALLMIIDDELYPRQVVRIWNDYCQDQNMNEDEIFEFCGDVLDEMLSGWSPSEIALAVRRTEECDSWFNISVSCSEIDCFPDSELFNYVYRCDLVDWLVENDRWKEYNDELEINEDETIEDEE